MRPTAITCATLAPSAEKAATLTPQSQRGVRTLAGDTRALAGRPHPSMGNPRVGRSAAARGQLHSHPHPRLTRQPAVDLWGPGAREGRIGIFAAGDATESSLNWLSRRAVALLSSWVKPTVRKGSTDRVRQRDSTPGPDRDSGDVERTR